MKSSIFYSPELDIIVIDHDFCIEWDYQDLCKIKMIHDSKGLDDDPIKYYKWEYIGKLT